MNAAGRQGPVGENPNETAAGDFVLDGEVGKDAKADAGEYAGLHGRRLVADDNWIEFRQHRLAALRKQPLADTAQLRIANPWQRFCKRGACIRRQAGCQPGCRDDDLLQGSQTPRLIAGIGEPADADAEIDLLVDQIADGVVEDRLDLHLRIFPEVFSDSWRHHLSAVVERRGET